MDRRSLQNRTLADRIDGTDRRREEREPLVRWAGLVTVLAAVVAAPAWTASVVQEDPVSSWPIIATFVALLLAIPANFAAQAPLMGRLGRIAVVLVMLGGMFEVSAMTAVMVIQAKVGLHGHEDFIMSGAVAPHFAALSGLAFLFYLGMVLFGVGTMRAGFFPRVSGPLTIAGSTAMVAGAVPDITALVAAGAVLLFAGFASMGWQLWDHRSPILSM